MTITILVPLGSRRELPAESCKEIKASEGEQAVSGNYWLDSTRSGNSTLARCDMKTKGWYKTFSMAICLRANERPSLNQFSFFCSHFIFFYIRKKNNKHS